MRVVLVRDPKGDDQDRAYFSTSMDQTPGQVLESYSSRWPPEVSFRDAKQLFGLTDPQYGFHRGKRNAGRPKPCPSFVDIVDALRIQILSRRLSDRTLKTGTLEETRNTLMAVGMAA